MGDNFLLMDEENANGRSFTEKICQYSDQPRACAGAFDCFRVRFNVFLEGSKNVVCWVGLTLHGQYSMQYYMATGSIVFRHIEYLAML